jgi:hypothetical protein
MSVAGAIKAETKVRVVAATPWARDQRSHHQRHHQHTFLDTVALTIDSNPAHVCRKVPCMRRLTLVLLTYSPRNVATTPPPLSQPTHTTSSLL